MADATTSAGAASGSTGPELGFDQILARLREVVIRLESGELTLEQSLVIYEEGVQLARRGQQLLTTAERRVEILLSASGSVEVVPFNERDVIGDADGAGSKMPRAGHDRGESIGGGTNEPGPG
ncbi:MAG: exodeoxyribonuclease VII small subunit [Deltaproteobacteria bacterium]|nr:MAG: exodeoxyribonuclease VII small subunit [Deltaproteobacteria bacterium]